MRRSHACIAYWIGRVLTSPLFNPLTSSCHCFSHTDSDTHSLWTLHGAVSSFLRLCFLNGLQGVVICGSHSSPPLACFFLDPLIVWRLHCVEWMNRSLDDSTVNHSTSIITAHVPVHCASLPDIVAYRLRLLNSSYFLSRVNGGVRKDGWL